MIDFIRNRLLRQPSRSEPSAAEQSNGTQAQMQERERLLAQIAMLQANGLVRDGAPPAYDADYLAVWHKNVDFMRDPQFMAAYRAGMDTGHKIGRPAGSREDIHIEWRILVCCWAAYHAAQLEGDFVECGTNTGIMSVAICNYIDFNRTGKHFYLFDTFTGIPEDQVLPEERERGRLKENEMFYDDCYELARANFSPFPKAVLVRGRVPDTLPSVHIERVCYLMLDMNIAVPELAALTHFWDRIVPGGLVLFDDYGWMAYQKQKEVLDDFAARHGVRILNLPTGQGMLIKPPRRTGA